MTRASHPPRRAGSPLGGRASRLSNAEFELGERLLKESGLATTCPCVRHGGINALMNAHVNLEADEIAAFEAAPCIHDQILFNTHCLLAGLGTRDLSWRWEDFDHPEHDETIRLYASNLVELVRDGIGLTLIGVMGTGKTSAATYLARQALLVWGSGHVTVTTFTKAVDAYKDERLDERLESSRLLVIDEIMIGRSEKQKELFDDRLSAITVGRYQNQRATLITANHTEDELAAEYPRTMSRLAETNETLVYTRADYRRANRRGVREHLNRPRGTR
jgi:hypothetical protein